MGLLLALDVGNTNTVIGFFEGDALVATARLTTVRERTSDEHALFLRAVIEGKGRKVGEVDDVIVSSVVPPQDFPIRAACRDAFGIDPLFVAPGVKTGMRILYDHPSEVGADRIVNAVAAIAAYGAPCIVVDFGTATTFDVVTAAGDYLGGVICPGPGISADALFSRAARLSRVDLHRPERVVGKNTAQSVQSGLYWGVLAQAEGLIARIRAELGEPNMKVVATGGLAPLYSAASPDLALVDPDLTLRGLKILHDRNADVRRPGAPEPAEDEASYGTRVEEAFISERGTPFLLSAKDWQLVCAWRDGGVPSDTVIRAIRGAFEKKRARGDLSKISSLAYCANAVEVLWEMERRGLIGSHVPWRAAEGEPFDAAPRLAALGESLRAAEESTPEGSDAAAAGEALKTAREAVSALDPSSGLEALEEALGKAEKALVKRLEKALGEGERERLAREVEEEAGDVSALSKDVQRRILSAVRGRAVRHAFSLPPLTLLGE